MLEFVFLETAHFHGFTTKENIEKWSKIENQTRKTCVTTSRNVLSKIMLECKLGGLSISIDRNISILDICMLLES